MFACTVGSAGARSLGAQPDDGAAPAPAPVAPTLEQNAVSAAQTWLAGLTPGVRRTAALAVNDPDRARWTYLPGARRGVTLMALDAAGRARALRLVRTGLSDAGWTRVRGIFALEGVLHAELGDARRRQRPSWRHPQNYTLALFGTPRVGQAWGWRIGGHHLSLNVGWSGGVQRLSTVSFGGSPATVRSGPQRGLSPHSDIEQGGARLFEALAPAAKQRARESLRVPGDLLGRPGVSPWGLRRGGLTLATAGPRAGTLFAALVRTWTGSMAPASAATAEAAFLRADPATVHLAWRGAGSAGTDGYFRIQAPGAHLEYWKGGNHIHTVLHLAPAGGSAGG